MIWRIFIFLVFFSALTSHSQQFNYSLGSDMKILIFGTENQFTSHSPRFNGSTKIEFIDERHTYFAIGYTYTDLNNPYQAFFANIGIQYTFSDKLHIIPQIELGRIERSLPGSNNNIQPLYIQSNVAFRYKIIEKLSVDFSINLQLARDLDHRTFRYGGILSLISPIFTPEN